MAAEDAAHAPTAGEYIIHHLQHLQNKKQTGVVDFSVVKERVGGWVDDHWDHTTLVNRADTRLLEFVETECAEHLGERERGDIGPGGGARGRGGQKSSS